MKRMAVVVNFNLPEGCDPAEICEWIEDAIMNRGGRPKFDAWHGEFGKAQIFVCLVDGEDRPEPR